MPSPARTTNTTRGFTLLQLLASISIIAVLMTLLIPVMGMVRETSRKVACANNLRQTGLLQFAYAGEYSGCLTPTYLRNDMPWLAPTLSPSALTTEIYRIHGFGPYGWYWDTWYAYLMRFVGSEYHNQWNQEAGYFNYLFCPSAKFGPPKGASLENANHWYGGSSYGMNTAVLGDTGSMGI